MRAVKFNMPSCLPLTFLNLSHCYFHMFHLDRVFNRQIPSTINTKRPGRIIKQVSNWGFSFFKIITICQPTLHLHIFQGVLFSLVHEKNSLYPFDAISHRKFNENNVDHSNFGKNPILLIMPELYNRNSTGVFYIVHVWN